MSPSQKQQILNAQPWPAWFVASMEASIKADECEGCEEATCQKCCTHGDVEHFICLDCGKEFDPGEAIDNAEYAQGDR